MDYASLIKEFGSRYGMDDLVPDENGGVGFAVDGRTMGRVLREVLPSCGRGGNEGGVRCGGAKRSFSAHGSDTCVDDTFADEGNAQVGHSW